MGMYGLGQLSESRKLSEGKHESLNCVYDHENLALPQHYFIHDLVL